MAVVYRAIDPATNAPVAVKAVTLVRPVNIACFRRETHALRRMNHPGIVKIREQGTDQGLLWCAMDLVEGTPFRRLFSPEGEPAPDVTGTTRVRRVRRREARPLQGPELRVVLRILQRLCSPLAFLHGEGLVHRDLKPENVVVRPDGTPVIIDFGLAASFSGPVSREVVSAEVHAELGTHGYMAPEQRRGELYDARVDIYAMGCMLYEALTGRRPQPEAPLAPADMLPNVDGDLSALTMRLLADDPRERLGFADHLASALAPWVETSSVVGPPAKTYLYRPTFAGRESAVAQLLAWIDRGEGGIAIVRGESGVGKTRLAMEVARHASRRHGRVITAECVPVSGTTSREMQAAPLHPLRPVLRAIADQCRASGPDMVERLLGKRLRVLAAYEPELLELATDAHAEPPELSPQAARGRLFADLAQTLAAFAAHAPVLVVIDDLQWSDELTLSFLVEQVGPLRNRGLGILGTFRSEASESALERLVTEAELVVDVLRMDGRSVASMVSDMLAIVTPPPALVQFMHDHSEGNPFFVAEYLRAAVHEGWLERTATGRWQVVGERGTDASLPLPSSLRELVTRRLTGLSDRARRFVDACAVFGRDVEVPILAAVLQLDDAEELEVIDELLQRQVLDEPAEQGLRFSHDKLREVTYEALDVEAQRGLHERIADTLERERGSEPRTFGVLAHHLLRAGLDVRAMEYLESAGEHALQTAAHGQARHYFDRALGLSVYVEPLRRKRWMRRVAEAAFGLGDIEESERRAAEALAQLTNDSPASTLGWTWTLARALARQGVGFTRPRSRIARSEEERKQSLETALVAGQLSAIYYFTGDALRMVTALLIGVNYAERAGSPAAVTESYARLGYVCGVAGLHRVANHQFDRAHHFARAGDQVRVRALTLYLHAFYHLGLAEWRDAEEKGRRAVELLREMGDRQDGEIAQTIAAHAVFFSGRFADARRDYEHVLESARGRGNRQHEAWGMFLIGRSELAMGNVDVAIDELERALVLLLEIADRFSLIMCRGLLADAYLARNDVGRAEALAAELDAQLGGAVVPLAACVHGYLGAANVRLTIAERSRGDARDHALASSSVRNLTKFARTFPMASAAALRARARWDLLRENRRGASKHLAQSIASAREHSMPYERALSHELLSTVADADARDHHREAERLFAELGARHDVERLNRLR